MSSPFNWQGKPRATTNTRPAQRTPLFAGLKAATNHRGGITLTGQIAGQVDAHKRDATRRGGI